MHSVRAETQRYRFKLKPTWVFAGVFMAFLFFLFGDKGLLELLKLHQMNERKGVVLKTLVLENQILREKIEHLRKSDEAIKREIKKVLGMVEPGEILVEIQGGD